MLHKGKVLTYSDLDTAVGQFATGLQRLGITPNGRVAVYLPKQFETVIALFGTAAAGGVFVPVNPLLKPEQVAHILNDSDAMILVTTADRCISLDGVLPACPALKTVIVLEHERSDGVSNAAPRVVSWQTALVGTGGADVPRIDSDMVSILYTSGSSGPPKGVVLSHRNLICGARSVVAYLNNQASDRLLLVLPLSFDYGLSQLTTAFLVGASVVLMDYLLPNDVLRAVARYRVTGLAAVPPLWNQLAERDWPAEAVEGLRYLTSSGGTMPIETTRGLTERLPKTDIFLMYGLTEAFRSTFLPPEQISRRPDSIGRPIPNADVRVVRPDGSECAVDEPGEIVHRGALVALGYWRDAKRTAERFRPAPDQPRGITVPELAVWSGDRARRDADGFLYFLGRDDAMIKTSGYRVSPDEIEEVASRIDGVRQAVALGLPHHRLGQGILLVVQARTDRLDETLVLSHCRAHLPGFMLPERVYVADELPLTAHGKIDRPALADRFADAFVGPSVAP